MVKESVYKCSECGKSGHTSTTCSAKRCLRLFGVNIIVKKSLSNAQQHSPAIIESKKRNAAHERKKRVAWTEEHRSFLIGLEKGIGEISLRVSDSHPGRWPCSEILAQAAAAAAAAACTVPSRLLDASFKETVSPFDNAAEIPALFPLKQTPDI